MFFMIVWTIWEARNHKIFRNIQPDIRRAEDMVKFRLGWWFKHFGSGSSVPITLIRLNIVECCSELPKKKVQGLEKWSPLMINSLYFNVDGSVSGSPSPARIGGVLRDHMGKILCFFSSFVGFQDVMVTELLAILRACELFGMRPELANRPLTVITDSKTVVGWVSGDKPVNISHEQVIGDIRNWLVSFELAAVEFRPRSSNSFADTRIKKGSVPGVEELWWSVF
ncbi:hypothetical protein Q3G72_027596 [Acer saccharum]|nr:hypothetical protein Q3G72_027596 [Acer saccharum]